MALARFPQAWTSGRRGTVLVVAVEIGARLGLIVWVLHTGHFGFDLYDYYARAHHMSRHHLPYRGFLWEFPPLTVVPILPAPFLGVVGFRRVFALLMMACEYGSLCLLRRRQSAGRTALTLYWSFVAVMLVPYCYQRLDPISVLFATLAITAFVSGGNVAVPATLGVLAKLWPIVFVVPLGLVRRWRQVVTTLVFTAAAVGAWYAFSPQGFRTFSQYRHGSGFQIESSVGAFRMLVHHRFIWAVSGADVIDPGRFGWADYALVGSWVGVAAAVFIAARRRRGDLLALTGGLVAAQLVLSRILSPQYLIWLLPFAALEWAERERIGTSAFAAAAVLTLVEFDRYVALLHQEQVAVLMVNVRNVLLVVTAVAFVRRGLSADHADDRTGEARETRPSAIGA